MADLLSSAVRAGAAVAALALLAACGFGEPPQADAGPSEARSEQSPADDLSLQTLPTDQAVMTRTGTNSLAKPIAGDFGPDYVLYARCRGQGELRIVDTGKEDFDWSARCDGVPSRVKVLANYRAVSLRLTTKPGVEWTLIVARSKAEQPG